MALVLLDRAKETTTVVGTGTATLLGAVTSYQSLAGVGNGNTTYYCIVDQVGANWEVGIGTYTASGTTLARTTVLASSNAGALVVFTTGVKDVFVTYPSEKGVWYDASGNVLFTGTTTAANLAYTGTLTGSTGILNIGSGQLYKDASGKVGIGTSIPTAVLQISSNATDTDFQSASSKAGIALNYNGSGISYYDSDTFVFRDSIGSGSAEKMRINSANNVTLQGNISVGGAAPATVGTGITFPATQSASSNANTLDDYEEGTWTPVLSFATTGTMTYTASTASGVYTKIGNVVTCRIALVLTAFTIGTASGQARISLPFTSAQNYFSAPVYSDNFTTTYPTIALTSAAVSYVYLYGNTAINTNQVTIAAANFLTASNILLSITYTV